MKDSRNILLLVLSLCLVATWGYHLYDKNNYKGNKDLIPALDSLAIQKQMNDSLRTAYNLLLVQADSSRNMALQYDTTVNALSLNEIDSLRNEISAILAINNITKEDLRRAEHKIRYLQQRLFLIAQSPVNGTVSSPAIVRTGATGSPTVLRNETVNRPAANTASLTLVAASFRAMETGSEQPTAKAAQTGNFNIACVLQSATQSFSNTEIYFVITDPSGAVIQDDPWQSGMFTTTNEDRIPYTRKARISYNKGDAGRIAINLKLSEYNRGTYAVQFYHNGIRIGKSDIRLY